jgi:hypothetical protein
MEHPGIKYSVVRGSQSDVWRWSVLVGQPKMLRLGEAGTEQQAEMLQQMIDRALAVQETLLSLARCNSEQ